jgi:hypothetical protein
MLILIIALSLLLWAAAGLATLYWAAMLDMTILGPLGALAIIVGWPFYLIRLLRSNPLKPNKDEEGDII